MSIPITSIHEHPTTLPPTLPLSIPITLIQSTPTPSRGNCFQWPVFIKTKPIIFGFRRCGLLTIDEPPYADLSNVITNVRGVGQECLQLTADEINKRFPGLNLSSLECGALEPATGFIQAELAVKSLQVRIKNIIYYILYDMSLFTVWLFFTHLSYTVVIIQY